MKTTDRLTRLIRIVNSCLKNDTPRDTPQIDDDRLQELLKADEIDEFMDGLNSDPPKIQAYRSKFYRMDHFVNEGYNHRIKEFIIMRDGSRRDSHDYD